MLEGRDLRFSYDAARPLLQGVGIRLEPGGFLAVLGVNGCGKSSLMNLLVDIMCPQEGSVLLDGTPLPRVQRRERARKVAYVAQHSHATRLSVYDAVLMGRHPHIDAGPSSEDHAVVEDVLGRLGLADYALRYVDELSGGEYQKVVLARAFAQQTDTLLLDEPTNNLDPANQHEVMQAIRTEVDRRRIAAAAVMHDVNLALRYCDAFLFIKDGQVDALGDASVVTPERMLSIYGLETDIIEHRGRRVVVAL
ncbi:ABC transporter ATP-binding protein [Slackia exigua]|uniref:ABC transporter ATP-binding protein n=1 Tax=Slackia exigua TaxID=84109 RepID=UPI003BA0827C